MTEITKEQFVSQRVPRRGRANPETFDFPVWKWLVREGMSAYEASQHFGCSGRTGPGWCFDRMGCSKTRLPDGRIVRIAGEHEDFYDPDFYIYNDVILLHPDGRIDIYGYPEDVFPPTDFHSATFDAARNCLWIVGNLGYQEQRRPGETPVHRLDLDSFEIHRVRTAGEAPGWIHTHTAELDRRGSLLRIRRGIREHESGASFHQTDDWVLDLGTMDWRRETHRVFRQWSVRRSDGGRLRLSDMTRLAFDVFDEELLVGSESDDPVVAEWMAARAAEAGEMREHFDPATYESLFQPPTEFIDDLERARFESDPDDDDWSDNTRFDRARLVVGACRVRYAEGRDSVELKIEGQLPPALESMICEDLVAKLSRLTGAPCVAELRWEQ